MKILLLSRYSRLGASSRLRFFQYLPLLRQASIECTVRPLVDDVVLSNKYKTGHYPITALIRAYANRIRTIMMRQSFDLVWIEKEALPWMPAAFECRLLKGVPYVLDYDDALFHDYDLHSSRWVRHFYGRRLDRVMSGASLVLCGNDYLAKRAKDAGAPAVEVLPTVIDLDRYPSSNEISSVHGAPRIVWIGSPSTVQYLELIYQPLLELRKCCAFTLRIIGARIEMPGLDTEYIHWNETTEVSSIQTCQVGVMPLRDSPWERGKCGYKLIQYMACALPVVASPVGVNREIVQENVNGFLADDERQWVATLETLLGDKELSQRMGFAGRKRVEEEYCIQKTAPRLIQYLQSVKEYR